MYCHVGTLFQFNVYSYPSLTSLTFYHVHTMFYMGRLKSWRWHYYLGRGHPFPFSRLLAFRDFVSGFRAFRLPHAIGHARRWEPAVSFGTKLRPIVSFHRSLRSPLKTFSHADLHLILFTTFFHLLRCFFELEKKSLNFKRFQTPKRLRCGG